MSERIFIFSASGFFGGVLASSYFSVSLSLIGVFALISISFLLLGFLGWGNKKVFFSLAIFFVLFALGALRFYVKDVSEPKNELDNFTDEKVEIIGVIKNEVEQKSSSQRMVVAGENIIFREHQYPIESNILVSTDLFPEFKYGELVKVSGKITNPKNFITDAGTEFDYIDYLKKDSIFYTMSFANAQILEDGKGNPIKTKILEVKSKFLDSIKRSIPAPESSLLSGLLLGVKSSLGETLQQDFVNTGLVHVVVLSGYNVTIIAEALIRALSFLSIAAGIYIGAGAIIVFVVMTGAGATITRAGIMALLALIARATGRNYEITRALIVAAFLMILQNPYILVFDISFQLSFLATLGLIYMSPVFKEKFKFLPEKFGIREIAASTIGVQISVLPFILYKMGNLSIVAPITNLLVLPLIPGTMLLGFITGVFSLISPILAAPVGFLAFIFLKFEIFIVQTFSHLPFSTIKTANFPFILVLILYIFIGWYLWRYNKKHKQIFNE